MAQEHFRHGFGLFNLDGSIQSQLQSFEGQIGFARQLLPLHLREGFVPRQFVKRGEMARLGSGEVGVQEVFGIVA
jgi:hypothetical protein